MRRLNQGEMFSIGEVKALAEFDDRAQNKWVFDTGLKIFRMLVDEVRPVLSALEAIFPKINAKT